jgi:hypothetical protein
MPQDFIHLAMDREEAFDPNRSTPAVLDAVRKRAEAQHEPVPQKFVLLNCVACPVPQGVTLRKNEGLFEFTFFAK